MISVIIPCYFADMVLIEITVRCLNSLNDTTPDDVEEVLIIDDGSPLTADFVDDTDFVQQFKLHRRERNGGYSAAANTGLYLAEGDILIVGNNDLTFTEGWLDALLKPLEEGFDVSTVWTSDQTYVLEEGIQPDAKFGSLFAMKRYVYDQIGGFDETFRGYFADNDYRKRILQEGFTIGKNLNYVVPHLAKATYKVTDKLDAEYQRAKLLYEIKWGYGED